MFKFAKNLFDRTATQEESAILAPPPPFTRHPAYENDISDINPDPEMIIGESVSVIGKIAFQREIRIEGSFEGELEGDGKVVVGPQGFVKANMELQEAEISGKV